MAVLDLFLSAFGFLFLAIASELPFRHIVRLHRHRGAVSRLPQASCPFAA
jgi:hypothetical protein